MLASHAGGLNDLIIPFAFIGIVAFIIWSVVRSRAGTSPSSIEYAPGSPYTVAARGILLEVSTVSVRSFYRNARLERRAMRVDVEIPGKEPYEIQGTAWFPPNLTGDLVPGASVELRVAPRDRDTVFIVGLGAGFSGALPIADAPSSPPRPGA